MEKSIEELRAEADRKIYRLERSFRLGEISKEEFEKAKQKIKNKLSATIIRYEA